MQKKLIIIISSTVKDQNQIKLDIELEFKA